MLFQWLRYEIDLYQLMSSQVDIIFMMPKMNEHYESSMTKITFSTTKICFREYNIEKIENDMFELLLFGREIYSHYIFIDLVLTTSQFDPWAV